MLVSAAACVWFEEVFRDSRMTWFVRCLAYSYCASWYAVGRYVALLCGRRGSSAPGYSISL